MDSRQNPEYARVNEELPSDYEKIVREELVRAQERLAKLTPVGEAGSLEPKIAAFRPGAANEITITADHWPGRKAGAARGIIGLALAICIAGGAIAWQTAYGEEVRQMIAAWVPQFASTSSSQAELTGAPAQQQVAAADAGAPQTPSTDQAAQQPPPTATAAQQPPQTAAAQQPPQSAAAQQPPQSGADQLSPPTAVATAPQDTTAAPSPDLSSSLQAIARNIGGLQQAVEQLKTTQDQMVHENAKVVEQLRASQEQMTRLLAKASEQNPHARMAAAPKPTRRPVATLPPPQPLPPQAEQVPADDLPITRPPKPVP